MMMGHCAMMRRSEGALAFLKTELAVTPAQSKVWDAFAAAYRSEAATKPQGMMKGGGAKMKGGGGMMGGGMMGGPAKPFPEAMAQHTQMMENHLASAKRLTDAARPLYDALSAEQRKSADELLPHFIMMRCPI
jgi:hypothetical protein